MTNYAPVPKLLVLYEQKRTFEFEVESRSSVSKATVTKVLSAEYFSFTKALLIQENKKHLVPILFIFLVLFTQFSVLNNPKMHSDRFFK